jgi:DNA polymerase sigma
MEDKHYIQKDGAQKLQTAPPAQNPNGPPAKKSYRPKHLGSIPKSWQPIYTTTSISPNESISSQRNPMFQSKVTVGSRIFEGSSFSRKKDAERDVALKAIKQLQEEEKVPEKDQIIAHDTDPKVLLYNYCFRKKKKLSKEVPGTVLHSEAVVETLADILKTEGGPSFTIHIGQLGTAFKRRTGQSLKEQVGQNVFDFIQENSQVFILKTEDNGSNYVTLNNSHIRTEAIATRLSQLSISNEDTHNQKIPEIKYVPKGQTADKNTDAKEENIGKQSVSTSDGIQKGKDTGNFYICECGAKLIPSSNMEETIKSHERGGRHKTWLYKKSLAEASKEEKQEEAAAEELAEQVVDETGLDEDMETEEMSNDEEEEEEGQEKVEEVREDKNVVVCECGKTVKDNPISLKNHKRGGRHKNFVARNQEHKKLDMAIAEIKKDPNYSTLLSLVSQDIMKYFQSVKPTESDIIQRDNFRKYLQSMLWTQWEDATLYLFGSSATQIFERDSDIDLCLIIPDTYGEETTIIRHLARYFRKLGVTHTLPLVTARVPILKLLSTGRVFRYKFDLCVNRPLGTHNSRLIRAYMDLDERVRPLAFTLKSWSKRTRIHNPSGGLTSYALYLLLIFFLQTRHLHSSRPCILPNLQLYQNEHMVDVMGYNCYFEVPTNWKSANTETVGQLLAEFFDYYLHFDWDTYAVCIRLGKLVPKSETNFAPSSLKPVVVEDPFEIDFNCTRLVKQHTLLRMKRLMKSAYISLFKQQNISELLPTNTETPRRYYPPNRNTTNIPRQQSSPQKPQTASQTPLGGPYRRYAPNSNHRYGNNSPNKGSTFQPKEAVKNLQQQQQ